MSLFSIALKNFVANPGPLKNRGSRDIVVYIQTEAIHAIYEKVYKKTKPTSLRKVWLPTTMVRAVKMPQKEKNPTLFQLTKLYPTTLLVWQSMLPLRFII